MSRKNIFVLGWDEFNFRHNLDTLLESPHYAFHELLGWDEVKGKRSFAVKESLELAQRRLDEFPGSIDAIIGYWDFPGCFMVPLLCERLRLPTVSLRSAFACEHKYWARTEQQRSIEEYPAFRAVNPFEDPAPPLSYPFWVKPVVACLGQLGFRVESESDWEHAMEVTRKNISRFGEPCDFLLDFVDRPPDVHAVDGYHCVAEEMISGWQSTVEGYAYDGEIVSYGVVDSFCFPDTSVFSRLEYPSRLPETVKERMTEISRRFLRQVDFEHGPFNIEYYWNQRTGQIWLLEINSRISQSHSNLFKKVDGVSHHKVMVELALGERPEMAQGRGPYRTAAKFMHSVFEDGFVRRVPSREEIAEIERSFDAAIRLKAVEGELLSEHVYRDEYSFPLAEIWLGAPDDEALEQRYRECVDKLPFEIEPPGRTSRATEVSTSRSNH